MLKESITSDYGYEYITIWSDKDINYNIEYVVCKLNKSINGL